MAGSNRLRPATTASAAARAPAPAATGPSRLTVRATRSK
ncbi:Uncharacterised protein [Bordetella pertussis]|nr:Uncharacterised protein [Bordetella pertussis]